MELSGASDRQLTAYRRDHVGFVFQFYNLIPSLTAWEKRRADHRSRGQSDGAGRGAGAGGASKSRMNHFSGAAFGR